jgi:soluble lytic murein transglycosylase
LRFLGKPWEGFERFEAMYHKSSMPITKARAAYWAGLASEALQHPEIAKQWYEMGGKYPTTFYGQMALAKLGRDSEPVALKPSLAVQVRQAFEKDDMIQAARIFYRAGIRNDASAFLRAYADKATTADQFFLAANLANDWQHYHDSVAVAKKAQTKGIIMADYAFPTMLARMKPIKTEWALVHAIIRQESQFDQQAQSPAGAQGLMQLMPATAKEVAKKAGMTHQNEWLTARPDYNIKLGSLYIAQMVSRFGGSYPLAIAAYNAGPGRVNSWIKMNGDPRTGNIDMIDWIEMIPVAETRNYVQRVLEGVYIYRHKFHDLQTVSAPIHTVHLQKPLKT